MSRHFLSLSPSISWRLFAIVFTFAVDDGDGPTVVLFQTIVSLVHNEMKLETKWKSNHDIWALENDLNWFWFCTFAKEILSR